MNRPRWRWALWCGLNWLHVRYPWRWLNRAWCWAIVPEWLGEFEPATDGEDAPF